MRALFNSKERVGNKVTKRINKCLIHDFPFFEF